MEFTPHSLAQRLVDLNLVEPNKIEPLWAEMPRNSMDELEEFKSLVLRKELVTNFQLDRLMTGERLGYFYGPYKVQYMIGAGTFARVFRAQHTKTGKVVAVKVLRRRHRNEVVQIEQFLREGRMGMELQHPNIVKIYEIENDPRTPFMVMEFVEGETLRQILKVRGKFSPIDALKVMHDICNGLDFAFSKGITHRDLKLSNVLVNFNGRCKLVDFGLAALADTSNDNAIADCPSARAIDYAALERGTGVRKGDPRSDIYFVGAMMYQILSGVPPLTESRDRMARLNVSRLQNIEPLSNLVEHLPPIVGQIVNKALEFKPDARYQKPGEMLQDIEKAQAMLAQGLDGSRDVSSHVTAELEAVREGEGKTVLIVESRADMQDLLRDKLKSRGYRVLIISDAQRAATRLADAQDEMPDCILISGMGLTAEAADLYDHFKKHDHTANIPTIFIADQRQNQLIASIQMRECDRLLLMPFKVRDLRATLVELLDTQTANSIED